MTFNKLLQMSYQVFLLLLWSTLSSSLPDEFPKGFMFGVASSAYQSEGAWLEDGKGLSQWDWTAHVHPDLIADHTTPDITTDGYHRYKQDIYLAKKLGFKAYRLSIAWTRILPNATISYVNYKAVRHYHNVLDEVLIHGLIPVVTMYHNDLPFVLLNAGGWKLNSMVDHFADYANLLFREYGRKVKYWITINEGIFVSQQSIENGELVTDIFDYRTAHNLIRGHGKVYRIYEKKYKKTQKGKISMTVTGPFCYPKTNSIQDKSAAWRCLQFTFGLFLHPTCSKEGDYPAVVKQLIGASGDERLPSRLPTFTPQDLEMVQNTCDYVALNYYTSFVAEDSDKSDDPVFRDAHVLQSFNKSLPQSCTGFQTVDPQGLRYVLNWLSDEYGKDIFITENGYEDCRGIEDYKRIEFLKGSLQAIADAIYEDGRNILGYLIWSFLDVWEFTAGYTRNFGVVDVDFSKPSRPRTVKRSGRWFTYYLEFLRTCQIERDLKTNTASTKME